MPDAAAALADALHDRYALERELGRGGMATVWLARDLKHERPVALKVLHPDLASSLGPDRFQREIKLAARLQHPHILSVYDSGARSGQLWFTMPYVEGESLRDRLNPANGQPPYQVFAFLQADVRIDYPVWSPDGKWVLFDRAAPRGGDLWMMEGVQ